MNRNHNYQQHFLKSPRLVAELIGHTNIRKRDVVYDLGAGSGVISAALARRAGDVVAVELDARALEQLRKNLAGVENAQIIKKDLLKLKVPNEPYKIFANIPFSLSARVVEKFAFSINPPRSMNLIVQRQLAQKLEPSDRRFNSALGAQLWPWFSVRIRRPLKRSDFTPPPAVDTVLLEIKPLERSAIEDSLMLRYRNFVIRCFEDQSFVQNLASGSLSIFAGKKPSELSPEQWVDAFKKYDSIKSSNGR